MITIRDTDRYAIRLTHDGDETISIHDSTTLDLAIIADKRIHAQLLITYDGKQMHLHTDLYLQSGSEVSILFWNKLSGALDFHLEMRGETDCHAHIGIGDITMQKSNYRLESRLDHEGMNLHMTTVCKAAHKHWQMEMNHVQPHTVGVMENFAVVEGGGDYRMEASGRIIKGAYASESHQTSRVLTMSQDQQSEVQPILLIDENEVKASHATTLGQPDEAQLYYLQSRGLSRKAALGLLTLGYFLPILSVVNQPDWQEQLQNEIEEKVIVHD